jgi:hypothetical protein
MTLAAAILIFGISSLMSVDPGPVAPTLQSQSSASAPVSQEPTPPSQAEPETTKPSSAQPSAKQAPANKPKASTAKKTHPKKKVVPAAACDPAPATSTASGSNSDPTSPQPGGAQASSTPEAPTPEAPQKCPPPKVIVKQGGITEQSIQLAGGSAGGEATQKKDAANRMLAATEDNLKKIAGRQLSATEQDSVSQIRQFVDQSKSALAAANVERAQTLAWKAKLLSDDLVNPQK